MTTEERLAKVERELARAKRRSRWLLAVGLATVGLLAAAWVAAEATRPAQAAANPRRVERSQRETVEEHEAAQNAIEFATMKRQADEIINKALRASEDAPDEQSAAAIRKSVTQVLYSIKSKNIRVQNAYSEYIEGALASYEDREARQRKAINKAGAHGGAAVVNEVRARRLVLVDAAGRERAVLRMVEDAPGLVLRDAAGKTRAVLDVDEDGPGLALFDAAGKGCAGLGVHKDGPVLRLFDVDGKTRAGLGVHKSGSGLYLYDESGKTRAGLAVNADGPGLALFDAAGKTIWSAP